MTKNPQQGVGGTTHSTDLDHVAWISWYQSKTEHLNGMCLSACHDMLEKFPDLKLVRGWPVNPDHAEECRQVMMEVLDPGHAHWWLETQDGKIVDPTQGQFKGANVFYLPFDETRAGELPTGKCPNDGWYCFRGNYFCSWSCEVSYMVLTTRNTAPCVRTRSVKPNPPSRCR